MDLADLPDSPPKPTLADDLVAVIAARETATKGPWQPLTHGTRSQLHAAALAHDAVLARRLPDSPEIEFTDMSWVRTEGEDWLNVALVGNGKDGPENSKFIALAANVIEAHGAELAALVEPYGHRPRRPPRSVVRLIDANALTNQLGTLSVYSIPTGDYVDLDALGDLIDAAPTVVPDDARLRAIIEQRFVEQGWSGDDVHLASNIVGTIALAVDDIMEYLGAKATE